jgi:hypothetical protein
MTTVKNLYVQTEAFIPQVNGATINPTQWGYVGTLDQALATTDSPTFANPVATSVVIDNGSFTTTLTSGATGNYGLVFPVDDGTASQVLSTNGSGVLSWVASGNPFNQDLNTTDNVTFNDVTVDGDLTVNGTTTTIDTADLAIADNMIHLNAGETLGGIGGSGTGFAGVRVERGTFGDAVIRFTETTSKWQVNRSVTGVGSEITTYDTLALIADGATTTTGDVPAWDANGLLSNTGGIPVATVTNLATVTTNSAWPFLQSMDQDVAEASDVKFNSVDVVANITVGGLVDTVDIAATIATANPLLTSSNPTFQGVTASTNGFTATLGGVDIAAGNLQFTNTNVGSNKIVFTDAKNLIIENNTGLDFVICDDQDQTVKLIQAVEATTTMSVGGLLTAAVGLEVTTGGIDMKAGALDFTGATTTNLIKFTDGADLILENNTGLDFVILDDADQTVKLIQAVETTTTMSTGGLLTAAAGIEVTTAGVDIKAGDLNFTNAAVGNNNIVFADGKDLTIENDTGLEFMRVSDVDQTVTFIQDVVFDKPIQRSVSAILTASALATKSVNVYNTTTALAPTLPEATAANEGTVMTFYLIAQTATNALTITANAGTSDTIEGAATLVLSNVGQRVSLLLIGNTPGNWIIV